MRRILGRGGSRASSPREEATPSSSPLDLCALTGRIINPTRELEELVSDFPLDRREEAFTHILPLALLLVDAEKHGILTVEEVYSIYTLSGVINETPSTPSAYQWNRVTRSCYHYSISELLRETRRSGMDSPEDESALALGKIHGILENVLTRLGDSSLGTVALGDYPRKMGSVPSSITSAYDQWLYPIYREALVKHWTATVMGARDGGLGALLPLLRRVKLALTEEEPLFTALFQLRREEPTSLAMIHFFALVEEYNLEWALAAMEWQGDFTEIPEYLL